MMLVSIVVVALVAAVVPVLAVGDGVVVVKPMAVLAEAGASSEI